MKVEDWAREVKMDVTVCNTKGEILDMNNRALKSFSKYGGKDLIGTNLLDCHPEASKTQIKEMLANQSDNIYTTEKIGVKKLIAQMPWYNDGEFAGLVELSIHLPTDMPHYIRD